MALRIKRIGHLFCFCIWFILEMYVTILFADVQDYLLNLNRLTWDSLSEHKKTVLCVLNSTYHAFAFFFLSALSLVVSDSSFSPFSLLQHESISIEIYEFYLNLYTINIIRKVYFKNRKKWRNLLTKSIEVGKNHLNCTTAVTAAWNLFIF